MSNQPEELNWDDVATANMDLGERLFKEGVSIAYDEDGDSLFLTIGEGGEAIAEQMIDGIYFRIDPITLKITGCIIVAFISDILANNKLAQKMFQEPFAHLRQQGNLACWEGLQAQKVQPLFALATSR